MMALSATATVEFTLNDAHRALERLDNEIKLRDSHIERRQRSIDSLGRILAESPDDISTVLEIAVHYTAFNNDSALHYLQRGAEMASGNDKLQFMLRQAALMPLDGNLQEACEMYDSICPDSLPTDLLPLYFESGRQMYSYMAEFPSTPAEEKLRLRALALERQKQLLRVVDPTCDDYYYVMGEYYLQNGEKERARALLKKVMETTPEWSNLRARAAHHLSAIAKDQGDNNTYLYYLSQAALADITAATREVAALQELGGYLYTRSDVDRAYTYLTVALASAVECGAPLRVIESSQMLPIIERAKTAQISEREQLIYIVLILLGILLVGLLILVGLLFRDMKRMKRLQTTLHQNNLTRESYMTQFLNLCSIYMDKLNQMCKITERKITTGKVDELLKLAKSGKFVEQQTNEFYEVFDNAFLHLYPEFPKKVNKLLQPDKQIVLENPNVLNNELRILAFMRMGINDSSRIAQVLNFSVNTIYAYRNRIKARAIDKDSFEEAVKNLSND